MENLDSKNSSPIENDKGYKSLKDIITMEVIKELVKACPNDMELGSKVRKIVNSSKG